MGSTLLTALGLMLVIEGLLPFLRPVTWRQTFERLIQLKDGQIRFFGLMSIVLGAILLFALKLF